MTTGAWWDTKVIEAGMNYQTSARTCRPLRDAIMGCPTIPTPENPNGYSKFSGVAKDFTFMAAESRAKM